MGIYTEKRDQLIEKIRGLEKRITNDTAKKKRLEDKLKEVSRLAMAEEYNCKPRELDEIISSEHQLLEKLRASGLSDEDLLKLIGGGNADNCILYSSPNEDDNISFYDDSEDDED
jgi:hypothetical protein